MMASAAARMDGVRRFLAFAFVGACATAIQYLVTLALVLGAHVALVPASAIGFVLSALANYLLNARFTFRSARAHRSAAPRFALTAGAGLCINSLLLSLFVAHGMGAVPAQVLTTLGVLVWNYGINSIWTFGTPAP